jgi:hypothetical protein
MGVRSRIFAGLAIFLVLLVNSSAMAIGTRRIDRVRDKEMLSRGDFEIIDDFLASGVQELLSTRDFTNIAKTRNVVLMGSDSATDSAAAQYSEQFSESAYKHISDGLGMARALTPQELRTKVTVNLLILVDGLKDTRLADLAMEMLSDESVVIRYWAVHCITNSGFIKQLNSDNGANSKLAKRVAEELGKIVEKSGAETLTLMVNFINEAETVRREDLLIKIADERISRYANWNVDYELLEEDILRALYERMEGVSEPVIARRFGQLYSYVMQRCMKGQDFLSSEQKNHLASVLIEVEKHCISKMLEVPQSIIQKAVEQKDMASLLLEHKRLFGNGTQTGQLALKLNFDYGSGPDGKKYISPLTLPGPPKLAAGG